MREAARRASCTIDSKQERSTQLPQISKELFVNHEKDTICHSTRLHSRNHKVYRMILASSNVILSFIVHARIVISKKRRFNGSYPSKMVSGGEMKGKLQHVK